MPPKSVRKKDESLNLEQEGSIKIEWMYYHFEYKHTFTCLTLHTIVEMGAVMWWWQARFFEFIWNVKGSSGNESKSHHFNIKHWLFNFVMSCIIFIPVQRIRWRRAKHAAAGSKLQIGGAAVAVVISYTVILLQRTRVKCLPWQSDWIKHRKDVLKLHCKRFTTKTKNSDSWQLSLNN